jgi:hypothetical protein
MSELGKCEHWVTPQARALIHHPLAWNRKICKFEGRACPDHTNKQCDVVKPKESGISVAAWCRIKNGEVVSVCTCGARSCHAHPTKCLITVSITDILKTR